MSIQAVAWVLEQSPTKALERLVMIALANHANEDGECWPSLERIAAEANTTTVQARRVLAALEAGGHVARTINAAPDTRMRGDRRTNLYRILDGGTQKVLPWAQRATAERANGLPLSARTGARSTRGRATPERAPNHQLNHQQEPSVNQTPRDERFVEFWQAYPRKVGKPSAQRAWAKAIKREDPEQIIGAAARYAGDLNRSDAFTAYPATWLNDDRWQDGPLPPRLGLAKPAADPHLEDARRFAAMGDTPL